MISIAINTIIATIIAETVITTLYLRKCDGVLSLGRLLEFGYTKLISGMVMCVALLLISRIPIEIDLLMFIVQVLAGAIVYALCLVILRDKFVFEIYNNQIKPKIYAKLKKEI